MQRETDIAVVGMVGRFPGARTLRDFWRNLETATESITIASDEELLRSGGPRGALDDAQYVRARSRLHDVEWFDAEFFGLSSREAEIMDPQHRLFLESAWEALEDAGYAGSTPQLRIGVYAGTSLSTYLLFHLLPRPGLLASVGEFETLTANDKDYLATRVSYKLDLRGPSVTVQTACSTSLVAVHLACQSLIGGECDLALAGGVTVVVPQERGYTYRPGGILSPDGHCRAFDASAAGTVFGNGLGIVVLRRLEDALADGDGVLAVIKGSSINNDGADKIGYTAPSAGGQAAVISEALSVAGVHPSTIGFVEAHGTGTPLGDPIEIAALSTVFAQAGVRAGSCAIGSVKTNIGHLDAAAGIAGLIKVVSALQAKAIPATLHFRAPNPGIDYSTSPFFVNTSLLPWPDAGHPRRAGVSSFGIGGTNAHVVLEEAPSLPAPRPSRAWHLLVLSARNEAALETAASNLRQSLDERSDDDLPDVAFTLQAGRKRFSSRRVWLARDRTEALAALPASAAHAEDRDERQIAFMFPGQGTQYAGMAAGLYDAEATFRDHVDRCAAVLSPILGADIREVMFRRDPSSAARLSRTEFAQPALFVVEYALAQLWMSWGIRPCAMIGHSLGEYVAACLAGVYPIDDALRIVAERARLMQAQPPGAMLAVLEAEHDVRPRLPDGVALAAVNGPRLSVVSGPLNEIARFEQELTAQGIGTHRLRTSHAFHSAMMEDVVAPLTARISGVELRPPAIPFVSNVSGTWMTAADAVDHRYWGHHLRQPVRFAEGVSSVMALGDVLLLEVGPGRTLADLARHAATGGRQAAAYSSLGRDGDEAPDQRVILESLGQLWLAGARIDWRGFYAHEHRRRVRLPTYPFQRKRYWIDPPSASAQPHELTPDWARPAPAGERPLTPSLYPRPGLRTPYEATQSDLEQSLARIWEDLLGTSPIGANDSFFELGGNSLLATRLASRLRDTFPVEVPLRALFESTTVRELARLLESLLAEKVDSLSEEEAARLLAGIGQGGHGP
jgi:phthiocerol/phenolphthiocerol synthesis type-I polyketide synthase E